MYLFLPSPQQEAFPFIPHAVMNKHRIATRQGTVIFSWWPVSLVATSDISEPNFVPVITSGPNCLNLQLHPFRSFAIGQLVF